MKTNPQHTLGKRISRAIRHMLGDKSNIHWEDMLGHTKDSLKNHIEKLFTKGMSWNKLLNGEIHIDHIKPKSLFKYETYKDKEFQECWALSNLQPLWAKDNLIKSNEYEEIVA